MDNKIKFFILSTKNKIFNLFDKIRGIFSRKQIKVYTLQNSLDKKLVQKMVKSHFPNFKQLRQISRFLSTKEKNIIKILIFVIFVCGLFLSTNFYLQHIKIVPDQTGEYTEGVVGSLQYINPLFSQINDVDADLVKLIFSGLFKFNSKTGTLKPDLAEKYEISKDQKTYTIYLKKNLLWQDGEPLTADDIIFTMELAKYPETKSPLGASFNGVEIKKINDNTIKFILNKPYSPFLSILTFGILPKHIWEDINVANINLAEYNLKPIGSGPYQVDSLIKDKNGNLKEYSLIINNKYYANQPFIKKFNLKFFSNYNEANQELKNKSIQGLAFSPQGTNSKTNNKEHLNHYKLILPQYISLFFNQEKNNFLKDLNIRKALIYGLNKNNLIKKILNKKGQVITGPFITKNWAKNIPQDEFNPQKSKELIKKSKFTKNPEDSYYKKEITINNKKEEKELTVIITAVNSIQNANLLEEIKKYWEKINVKVNIKLVNDNDIKKIIDEKDYEILLYGEIVNFNPDPLPFWHSSQDKNNNLNLSGFSNKTADKLLEEAEATLDPKIREEKYKKFQEILTKERPAIFLYQPIYDYTVDKSIKGIKIEKVINPADRFANINNWYIKTKKQFFWKTENK